MPQWRLYSLDGVYEKTIELVEYHRDHRYRTYCIYNVRHLGVMLQLVASSCACLSEFGPPGAERGPPSRDHGSASGVRIH
jgi:hypothetical protein